MAVGAELMVFQMTKGSELALEGETISYLRKQEYLVTQVRIPLDRLTRIELQTGDATPAVSFEGEQKKNGFILPRFADAREAGRFMDEVYLRLGGIDFRDRTDRMSAGRAAAPPAALGILCLGAGCYWVTSALAAASGGPNSPGTLFAWPILPLALTAALVCLSGLWLVRRLRRRSGERMIERV